MKKKLITVAATASLASLFLAFANSRADTPQDELIEGFKLTEVASVADAMEQLYGQRAYMHHDMRPLFPTKFAGRAVTVQLNREENSDGSAALQGMLDTIDESPAGSVYVMVVQDGLNYAGIGGLMSTAMKYRGFAGAVVDGGMRDTPQVTRLQFPVFSRGIVPSTTVNHYRFGGRNVQLECAGVTVRPNDIVVADLDGVAVVPAEHAADVLKKAQQLDDSEHSMLPFIEKYKSIREAVRRFGRL